MGASKGRGPEECEARRVGGLKGGGRKVEAQNFAFFLLPFTLPLLGALLVELWLGRGHGPPKLCLSISLWGHFVCLSPGPTGRRGFARDGKNVKTLGRPAEEVRGQAEKAEGSGGRGVNGGGSRGTPYRPQESEATNTLLIASRFSQTVGVSTGHVIGRGRERCPIGLGSQSYSRLCNGSRAHV